MSSSINLGGQGMGSVHASHSRSLESDDFLDALSEADDQSEDFGFDQANSLSNSGSPSRSGETSSGAVQGSSHDNSAVSSSSEVLIIDPDDEVSETLVSNSGLPTFSGVQSSDNLNALESITDVSTSQEDQGPGGCCSCSLNVGQSLKAGLVQMVSTALTFGIKPWVEEGLKAALAPAVGEAMAGPIAGIVGGVFIGVIHTTVSKTVSSVMNSALSMTTYTPTDNQLRDELATIDAPVTGAFVATYALRGGFVDPQAGHVAEAVSKTIASSLGGLIQGVVTDVLRQTAFSDDFDQGQAPELSDIDAKEIAKTAVSRMLESGENAGHDYFGKVVGAVVGNMTAPLWGGLEMSGWASGALGMTTFLASWFGGIHGGAFAGDQIASAIQNLNAGDDQPNANGVPSESV
ncbi:hypothetical protein [Breoghania corrubedonensis]|nr:hypothetical protein [Breoghania corrubedonensis]